MPMPETPSEKQALVRRLVRLTPGKVVNLVLLGLLFPIYFSVTSQHFRPGEWGGMFWVVAGILWLLGVLSVSVAYLWFAHLANIAQGNKS